MKNLQKILLLFFLITSLGLSKAEVHYVKTGYFTHVYAREHATDMPRGYYMLIEADGTVTPIWFHRYSTKNKGEFSKWAFDPRVYLGKVISIDVTGVLVQNNNEFPKLVNGEPVITNGKMELLKNFELEVVNSWKTVSTSITVEDDYKYPNTDTLLIPHDVLVEYEEYADKTPTKVIQLTNYVTGAGTEASPYTSTDGYGGFKAACAALPDGGTIEVPAGVYKATANRLNIPRFVSIKGVGASKPRVILANDRMWYLKGSNTIDNIDLDFTEIDRSYTHEVLAIHNNARDVTIKNTKLIGNYEVEEGTYKESGNVVFIRMYSHLNNITFDSDTLVSPLRGIVTKGQRNQHNITFKNCLFTAQGQMCVSLDQSSNISNVLFENNKFMEFSHFGVALARINGVTFRNNTFYSRNLMSFNTYNQAFHIEEHTQNVLIEDNHIDVIFRHSENDNPNTLVRSDGFLAIDSRWITVRNNTFKNSDLIFNGNLSNIAGHSLLENNDIDNGGIDIRDVNSYVTVKNNTVNNPPVNAIYFYSTVPRHLPFKGHLIDNNKVTNLMNASAFSFKGEMKDITISNNEFQGCRQNKLSLDLSENSSNLELKNNTFRGLSSRYAFEIVGDLPSGVDINMLSATNDFIADCTPASLAQEKAKSACLVYPNPVAAGSTISLKGEFSKVAYRMFNLLGAEVRQGTSAKIDTDGLQSGVYLLTINADNLQYSERLVIKE